MKKNKENELDYENDIRDIGDELEEEIKNGTINCKKLCTR